jgi:hypothetical protein
MVLSRVKHLLNGTIHKRIDALESVHLRAALALAKEELQRTAVEMVHISHTYSSGEATKAVKRIRETLEKL